MSTINELIAQGYTAARKPYWNPTAKLEFPARVGAKGHGPWFILHDTGQSFPMTFNQVATEEPDWLPIPPPISESTTDTANQQH